MELGKVGIWWSGSWRAGSASPQEVAAEMESLGYGALWLSAGFRPGLGQIFSELLAGTERAAVASGILSVWPNDPAATAHQVAALGPRFLLGIGASHAPIVESEGERYERPVARVAAFLDGLDAAEEPVPPGRRVLAALGPRMLALAAERSLGAHPYFVTLQHTAQARLRIGPEALLAPEVAVVLASDPAEARAVARSYTTGYLGLENYARNLLSLGWASEDLQSGGSDRLVDALVPWGSPQQVADRLRQHLSAGADHVSVQALGGESGVFPLRQYRLLAEQLF